MDVVQNYLINQLNKDAKFIKAQGTLNFNKKIYFENLKTSKLGSIVLHTKLSKSTMDTIDS